MTLNAPSNNAWLRRYMPPHEISRWLVNTAPGMNNSLRSFQHRFLHGPPKNVPPRMIYFIGDSTARNLFHALCLALDKTPVKIVAPKIWRESWPSLVDSFHLCRGRYLLASFFGAVQPGPRHAGMLRETLRDYPQPSAIVVSMGLWGLNPAPFQPKGWPEYAFMGFASWFHFELNLKAMLDEAAALAPAVQLMTVHPICEARMAHAGGYWQNLIEKLNGAEHDEMVRNCTDWVEGEWMWRSKPGISCLPRKQTLSLINNSLSSPKRSYKACYASLMIVHTVTRKQAHLGCSRGWHTHVGAENLNQRMRALVRQRSAEGDSGKVQLVNTSSLLEGRCADGNLLDDHLHYHLLIFEELALLFDKMTHDRGVQGLIPPFLEARAHTPPVLPCSCQSSRLHIIRPGKVNSQ